MPQDKDPELGETSAQTPKPLPRCSSAASDSCCVAHTKNWHSTFVVVHRPNNPPPTAVPDSEILVLALCHHQLLPSDSPYGPRPHLLPVPSVNLNACMPPPLPQIPHCRCQPHLRLHPQAPCPRWCCPLPLPASCWLPAPQSSRSRRRSGRPGWWARLTSRPHAGWTRQTP